jgi:hypothetical protein
MSKGPRQALERLNAEGLESATPTRGSEPMNTHDTPNALSATLGIHFEEPFGRRHITVDEDGRTVVGIGMIVVLDGVIHAVPRPALTPTEAQLLRDMAEDAFFNPPSLNGNWEHSEGVGEPSRWTSWIRAIYTESRCAAVAPDFAPEVGE